MLMICMKDELLNLLIKHTDRINNDRGQGLSNRIYLKDPVQPVVKINHPHLNKLKVEESCK